MTQLITKRELEQYLLQSLNMGLGSVLQGETSYTNSFDIVVREDGFIFIPRLPAGFIIDDDLYQKIFLIANASLQVRPLQLNLLAWLQLLIRLQQFLLFCQILVQKQNALQFLVWHLVQLPFWEPINAVVETKIIIKEIQNEPGIISRLIFCPS